MKGIDVILKEKVCIGEDEFYNSIYDYRPVTVHNVLVAPSSDTDIVTSIELYGKRAEFTIGIPKGDTHDWENAEVEFFGHKWKTFGFVTQGIEANVPTKWHKKVMCFRHE